MGKHNGKARKSGLKVGGALANKAKKEGKGVGVSPGSILHTTDVAPNQQSILEVNDLMEFMEMAELAGADFAAERQHVIVLSTGVVSSKDAERDARDRMDAEERNSHRLTIPRRPAWSPNITPDQLDQQERAAFLAWRRGLAGIEDDERLVLTPFEKNLEVWRQLWRVMERSDIVVQVVDARSPLTYHSEDLEAYAREIHPTKGSLLLLNKADLLSTDLREAWAEYFDGRGVDYVFWSAKSAVEEDDKPSTSGRSADAASAPGSQSRSQVVGVDELLEVLESKARRAVASAHDDDPRKADPKRRPVVGLTGFPNVGKSSTINALYGSKKTAVAPTPGKTKHFQTLNVSPTLCLCDCPGLVLPRFADSKADMVVAGVLPIDRLTDVRAPVEVVTRRISRQQLESVYGIKLPAPGPHEDPNRPPTAAELLRSIAIVRGWVVGSGLPDETRVGRQLLKDYVAGKLLYCEGPPGWQSAEELQSAMGRQGSAVMSGADSRVGDEVGDDDDGYVTDDDGGDNNGDDDEDDDDDNDDDDDDDDDGGDVNNDETIPGGVDSADGQTPLPPLDDVDIQLGLADLELLDALGGSKKPKSKRPEHKFHKKPVRGKGNRGKNDDGGECDGGALRTGKRGGLIRVSGY